MGFKKEIPVERRGEMMEGLRELLKLGAPTVSDIVHMAKGLMTTKPAADTPELLRPLMMLEHAVCVALVASCLELARNGGEFTDEIGDGIDAELVKCGPQIEAAFSGAFEQYKAGQRTGTIDEMWLKIIRLGERATREAMGLVQ